MCAALEPCGTCVAERPSQSHLPGMRRKPNVEPMKLLSRAGRGAGGGSLVHVSVNLQQALTGPKTGGAEVLDMSPRTCTVEPLVQQRRAFNQHPW